MSQLYRSRGKSIATAILILAVIAHRGAIAQSTAFTYQGQLKQNGQPYSGSANMIFSLYNVASGGSPLGTQTINNVSVTNGPFTVTLNDTAQLGPTAFDGNRRWLEITVNGTLMSTRQEVTASPYSLMSAKASSLALPLSATVNVNGPAVNIHNGATTGILAHTGGAGYGTYGFNTQDSGVGAIGQAIGNGGIGVSGWATGSGTTYGVYGLANSPQGYAGYFDGRGYFSGNVGIGVSNPALRLDVAGDSRLAGRIALGNDGSFGSTVYADYAAALDVSHTVSDFSAADNWAAFRSYITLNTPVNLGSSSFLNSHDFECLIPAGNTHDYSIVNGPYSGAFHAGSGKIAAIYGGAIVAGHDGPGTINYMNGAYFLSQAAATGTVNTNVGIKILTGHYGTGGSITNDYSVYVLTPMHSRPLTNHYGIYLENQNFGATNSYAIYSAGGNVHFSGNLDVTGTVSKGAGSFKIDHPLDPENKYLYHSFVESPDMMNIYNGNAVLDTKGEATITLPDWFEALNRDFRYQLTCIGAFAPVYVAQEITGNHFRIGGGKAGQKVSWQVTGIRHDAYANAHRIPVEQEKPASERGAFLHATEHGQALERGIETANPHGADSAARQFQTEQSMRRRRSGCASTSN